MERAQLRPRLAYNSYKVGGPNFAWWFSADILTLSVVPLFTHCFLLYAMT